MRCEHCQGRGHLAERHIPCHVCAGSGIAYCCDEAGANPPNTTRDSARKPPVSESEDKPED